MVTLGTSNFAAGTGLDSHSSGSPPGFAAAVDGLQTALDGLLSSSATTVTVLSTTGFPTAGYIIVGTGNGDDETIPYTGTTATTFTGCTRGASARSHIHGTTVASALTAEQINSHSAAIAALENAARYSSQNLLIGGNCPPQQRGNGPFDSTTTPANSDATYIFDNWYVLSDGNDIADVSRVTTGLPDGADGKFRLDIETANKKVGLFQIVEQSDIRAAIKAGCASLSFDYQVVGGTTIGGIRAAIFCWSGTADAPTRDLVSGSSWGAAGTLPTLVTSWAVATGGDTGVLVPTTSWQTAILANATIPNTTTNMAVGIWVDDLTTTVGEFLELSRISLVAGAVAIPAATTPVAVDAGRAKRFFYVQKYRAGVDVLGFGQAYLTTAAIIKIDLPVAMAKLPTFSKSAVGDFILATAGFGATTFTTEALYSWDGGHVAALNITVSSGLVIGDATMLLTASGQTGAWHAFDARF